MLKIGRKKPSQERSRSSVEAIYQAVTRILAKDGAIGLTTNKIAETAGISVGSLYQYFRNKESILNAILLEYLEKNLDDFERLIKELKPAEMSMGGVIRIVVQTQHDGLVKMGRLSSLLFQYAPQILPASHFRKADERIVNFLLQKMKEYDLKIGPENPELAFFVCSQSVRSVMYMNFLHRKPEERQRITDELTDMLTVYLETKKP